MTSFTYNVYVAVFSSVPDYQKNRHVGLNFEPTTKGSSYYFDIVGGLKAFVLHKPRENYKFREAAKFATAVYVGTLSKNLTVSDLDGLMKSVKINNDDYEYNCHTWAEQALLLLKNRGYLTETQYNAGVNGMVDATMEAKDDL